MAEFHEDIIQKLPRQSAEKVRALIEAKDLAYGGLRLAMSAVEDCRRRLEQAEANAQLHIQQLPRTRPHGAEERALEPVKRLRAELDRVTATHDRARSAWEKFHYLEALREWTVTHFSSGGQLAHDPLPPAKLAKAETPRQALARIRADIEHIETAWDDAQSAPMPIDELKTEMAATVDAIAARGAPSIDPRIRNGDPAKIHQELRLDIVNGNKIGTGGSDFFVWLMRDELIKKLNAQVDTMKVDGALSDSDREKLFSELADRRLELERTEESLIVAAAKEGMVIDRRLDADPRAILEVVETFDGEPS
ncbi:hypothetical protein [Hoeflea ulvae]|uniref:DUF222 domain-containing protein n=1 Tax=Hoeflea ulvae TaxID=2983764 RepID=A0ABT3YFM0_9HYPH|nr:hypothetical protein [Hoeflea ulvae]MCY0094604.1 hypothetical protein [Hoeflea ulvae]